MKRLLIAIFVLSLSAWAQTGPMLPSGVPFTPSGGSAAITLVAHNTASNVSGGNAVTTATNMTGATLLVACGSGFPGGFTSGSWMSDSSSNTWNYLTAQTPGFGDIKVQIAYAFNPTVSSTQTFTGTNTSHLSIAVSGWSNTLTTSGVFDKQNGAVTNSATSLATGSVTPAVTGELLFSCFGTNTASIAGLAIDNSLTILDSISASQATIGVAYRVYNSTSAINPTWSWTGAEEVGVSIGTFEP